MKGTKAKKAEKKKHVQTFIFDCNLRSGGRVEARYKSPATDRVQALSSQYIEVNLFGEKPPAEITVTVEW